MIKYRIYPSLLDSYIDYLDAEKIWEKYWGSSEEPSISLDDYVAKAEAELIDKINRVEHEPIEAADKGTCFNEIIDRINSGGEIINPNVMVKTVGQEKDNNLCVEVESDVPAILAMTKDFRFLFDIGSCKEAAAYFEGSIPQHFCKATIDTSYGEVELYGYADEIKGDKVYDIKTCGQYDYGKFSSKCQKEVYPYCLTESGEMEGISEFEYTVFVLGKKEPYTARMYKETYPYIHDKAKQRIRLLCESFIEFLDIHKDKITDKRIFNIKEN